MDSIGRKIHRQKSAEKQTGSKIQKPGLNVGVTVTSFFHLSHLTASVHPLLNVPQWVTQFIAQKPAFFPDSYIHKSMPRVQTRGRIRSLCLVPSLDNYPEFNYCIWKDSLKRVNSNYLASFSYFTQKRGKCFTPQEKGTRLVSPTDNLLKNICITEPLCCTLKSNTTL